MLNSSLKEKKNPGKKINFPGPGSKMKNSYLKKIIKEELKKILSERTLTPPNAADVDPRFVRTELHKHVIETLNEILKLDCNDTFCVQGHQPTGVLTVNPDNPKVFILPTNIIISIAGKEQEIPTPQEIELDYGP